MAKKRWMHKSAETARQIDAARDRRDREERTGGSLRGAADGALFAIDRAKGGSRALFKKDGLLTSVRQTMPGTSTKPAKVARPLKGQTARPLPKHARARAPAPAAQRHKPVAYGFDAWGEDDDGFKAPLLISRTSIGQLLNPRAPPRPEPSLHAPLEIMPPGASYNPAYGAHQALLRSALDSELERQAAKARYAHARAASRAVDEYNLVGNLADSDDDDGGGGGGGGADAAMRARGSGAGESDCAGDGVSAARAARAAERKTRAERNRLTRRKAHEVREARRLAAKSLDQQLRRVAAIAREVEQAERAKREADEHRPRRPEELLGVPKKLGRFKQRTEPWAALLSDELPSSLRALPPDSTLLSDRYRSVHRRNLMEPRMAQTRKRRYALKEYTKKGFKEEDWQKL